MRFRPRSRRGLALALTIMVATIVLVLAMGMSTMAQQNLNSIGNDARISTAYYSAVAGANVGLRRLQLSSSFSGFSSPVAFGTNGSFIASITPEGGTAPDGTVVPTDFWYVLATGYNSPTGPGSGVHAIRIGTLVPEVTTPTQPYGQQGIAGNTIGMPDAALDSYDSSPTPSSSSSTLTAPLLATNATAANSVDLAGPRGGATVAGTAVSGVGSIPSSVVQGYSSMASLPTALTTALNFPPPVVPSTLKNATATTLPSPISGSYSLTPGKYTNLNVWKSATITFSPGDYYFTGNIDVAFAATLKNASLTSGVNIYVDGKVTLDKDNQVNMDAGSRPGMFNLFSTGSSIVQADKNLQARWTIYAPQSTAYFKKDTQLWGAIVASSFDGKTGAATDYTRFHYDRSLQDPAQSVVVKVTAAGSPASWRRY